MSEWEEEVKKIWKSEYDYILEEINRLFEEKKMKIAESEKSLTKRRALRKNLELIRIYLPKKDFKFLEEYKPFKKYHNLGGIPVKEIDENKIRIDIEMVNPRKRKRRTIIYVGEGKG